MPWLKTHALVQGLTLIGSVQHAAAVQTGLHAPVGADQTDAGETCTRVGWFVSPSPLGYGAQILVPTVRNSEEILTATATSSYDSWHERHTFPPAEGAEIMGRKPKDDAGLMDALAAKVAGIVAGDDQPTDKRPRVARPRKSTTPAVAYMRCSGLGQNDGDTWDRQEAAISKYARGADLAVADGDWFRDVGVSGTKDLDSRPGLAALLDRIESNGVRVVLVENATRLARDLMVSEVILAQLRDAGCRVIACDSGHDLIDDADDDPTRRLIRQVLGAVAEFDRRVTVLKLRAARERIRRRSGRCEGRKPYGSRPGEAAIIARIRELHRKPHGHERRSLADIARILNDEGVPTRTGKPWSKSTLHQIIGRGLKAPENQGQ